MFAAVDATEYVLSPCERLADDQVERWGIKIPAWKQKIREQAAAAV